MQYIGKRNDTFKNSKITLYTYVYYDGQNGSNSFLVTPFNVHFALWDRSGQACEQFS
jgi:hypothetical protein